jgi:hypothetical protein
MDGQGDTGYSGWEAGQEFVSEEEYQRATQWLANKLLRECSREELAVIAAQHVIYADTLKASSDSMKVHIDSLRRDYDVAVQLAQLKGEIAEGLQDSVVSISVSVAKQVIAAYQKREKNLRSKGGKARHKDSTASKAPALNDWEMNGANYSSRAAFARQNFRKYSVVESTLYRWVREYEEAKKTSVS